MFQPPLSTLPDKLEEPVFTKLGATLVTVYSKKSCVQCNATYRALDAQGTQYEIIDMTQDASAMEKAKSLGHLQAPVVVAPDGTHWSGFDPDRIKALAA